MGGDTDAMVGFVFVDVGCCWVCGSCWGCVLVGTCCSVVVGGCGCVVVFGCIGLFMAVVVPVIGLLVLGCYCDLLAGVSKLLFLFNYGGWDKINLGSLVPVLFCSADVAVPVCGCGWLGAVYDTL